MTRAERAAYIDRRLAELYPNPPIPLGHQDAFTLLIAVLLSAHSTDRAVNKVTPELYALADTPEKMAALPVAEIQRIIRPVWLSPAKAKAISGLSQILVAQHHGQVPRTFAELEELGAEKIRGHIVFFNYRMNPLFVNTFRAYGDAYQYRGSGPAIAAQ